MRSVLMMRSMVAATALTCVLAAPAGAQTTDRRTLFTFSGPIAMPGVTLPAGTYLFRLPSPTERRVVQVLSGDGRTPYGMFFTLPAERPEAAVSPEVRFMETAEGMPAALKSWWYPGERLGFEFVYPKDQARRLARGATQPVLTTQGPTTTTAQTDTDQLSRVSASGSETGVVNSDAPVVAAPTGAVNEGTLASSSMSIATPQRADATPASASSVRRARTRLPQTATNLPLLAIFGTSALVGAAAIRRSRRS